MWNVGTVCIPMTTDTAERYVEDPNYFRLQYQLAAMQLNAALRGHAIVIDGHRASPQDLLNETVASASAVIEECEGLLQRYRTDAQRRKWQRGFRKHRLRPSFTLRASLPKRSHEVVACPRAPKAVADDLTLAA